jgi:hypothetical protein
MCKLMKKDIELGFKRIRKDYDLRIEVSKLEQHRIKSLEEIKPGAVFIIWV